MRERFLAWFSTCCKPAGECKLEHLSRSYINWEPGKQLRGARTSNGLMRDIERAGHHIREGMVYGMSLQHQDPTHIPTPRRQIQPAGLDQELLQAWLDQCCKCQSDNQEMGAELWDSFRMHWLYHEQLPKFVQFLKLLRESGYEQVGKKPGEVFGGQIISGLQLRTRPPERLIRYRYLVGSSWVESPAGHGKYLAYIHQYNRVWQARRRQVLQRELCEHCGLQPGVQAHHRDYLWLYFERPQDLVLLCNDCHRQQHQHYSQPFVSLLYRS